MWKDIVMYKNNETLDAFFRLVAHADYGLRSAGDYGFFHDDESFKRALRQYGVDIRVVETFLRGNIK